MDIGTGSRLYEFCPRFQQIGDFSFSSNSSDFIIKDKSRQTIKIYRMDRGIGLAAERVLEAVGRDAQFWENFQIKLDRSLVPVQDE